MSKILNDMPLFVEVAKQKSFSRAADNLDMPVSTLSRRISTLEKELGVPLLLRNSRNVELTESGRQFYERCEFIVAEAELARENLLQNSKSPSGKVRLAIPADAYHSHMADMLLAFAVKWPDIHLQIHLTDRHVDLLTEPFDLELRFGPLGDSSLKARKLATVYPRLYASPKLLEFYGLPQSPRDLENLPGIMFSAMSDTWTLHKGKESETVSVKPVHTVNHLSVAVDFALAGLGIAWLAEPLTQRYVDKGELVVLLPEWTVIEADINIIMASAQQPRRVRLFIEHLVENARLMKEEIARRGWNYVHK